MKRHSPTSSGPPLSVVRAVFDRDDGRCVACGLGLTFLGRGWSWSVQHRKARGMGGTKDPAANHPSNLIVLCGHATSPEGCHHTTENNPAWALQLGYRVGQHADPAAVPLLHHRLGWVLCGNTYTPVAGAA